MTVKITVKCLTVKNYTVYPYYLKHYKLYPLLIACLLHGFRCLITSDN